MLCYLVCLTALSICNWFSNSMFLIRQPHFSLTYVLFDVLMAVNRKYTARDAVYFPPDLRHLSHYSVSHRTSPNLPFFVFFFTYYKNQLWFAYTPDQAWRKGGKFFGIILYIHFLCLYRRNFLIRIGGEQINYNLQIKLDGYTCYSRKPYNFAITDFEFLHLWSCIWTLLEEHLLKAEKKSKTARYGRALQSLTTKDSLRLSYMGTALIMWRYFWKFIAETITRWCRRQPWAGTGTSPCTSRWLPVDTAERNKCLCLTLRHFRDKCLMLHSQSL